MGREAQNKTVGIDKTEGKWAVRGGRWSAAAVQMCWIPRKSSGNQGLIEASRRADSKEGARACVGATNPQIRTSDH